MKIRIEHILASIFVSLTAIPSLAQNTPLKIDERVRLLMDNMIAGYRSQVNLQEKVTFKFFTNVPEMTPELVPVEFTMKLQRPNKLALSWSEKGKNGIVKKQLISDGLIQTDFWEDSNIYTQTKAPSAIPAAPAVLNVPEFELLFNGRDPFINLRIPSQNLKVGDSAKYGDIDCDVLIGAVSQPALNLLATLKLGIGKKDHLIRGMVFEGNGGTPDKPIKFKYEAIYEVIVGPNLKDADFAFTPPPGAKIQSSLKKP